MGKLLHGQPRMYLTFQVEGAVATTIEEIQRVVDASCSFGAGDDPDATTTTCDAEQQQQETTVVVDQHWGSDPQIIRMRNKLRDSGSGVAGLVAGQVKNRRPPVFLLPGLASTRLVAWRYKACPQHPLLSDIKVLDYGTYVCVCVCVRVYVCVCTCVCACSLITIT